MESGRNVVEPNSPEGQYSIDWMPSELFIKFRKEIEGLRVGINFEFYNAPLNEFHTKLVFEPLSSQSYWKLMYEPIHQEVRVQSKKIPISKFLNLQVGIGHNFKLHAIGWNWRLSTCFGANGMSRIQNKTKFGLYPGFDLRFGWRADYVLPEIKGSVGGTEPLFDLDTGKLHASLDRVEAIITHRS